MRWRERLRDPAWDDPLIVIVSAALALLVIATGAPPELRVPITLWFFLTGPGLALMPLLGLADFRWVGVVSGSLAVDVVVTELMLYAGVWSLSLGVAAILIVCAIGVGLQVYRLETADIRLPAEPPTVDKEPEPAETSSDDLDAPEPWRDGDPPVVVVAHDGSAKMIDLNRASANELYPVHGIGPTLAARIVEYREANGPFSDAEELLQVPGIGRAHVAEIAKAVRIS